MYVFIPMLNRLYNSLFYSIHFNMYLIACVAYEFDSTHWGREMHVVVSELSHHLITEWTVACSVPSHSTPMQTYCLVYRKKCISMKHYSKFKSYDLNIFQYVMWKMSAILSQTQCFDKHQGTSIGFSVSVDWMQNNASCPSNGVVYTPDIACR